MVNIILVSHGVFCEGLRNGLKMITGDDYGISAVPLFPGETPETYRSKLARAIQEKYTEEGILILSDISGGTPFNSAVYLGKDYKIGLISGMNMPMLLNLVLGIDEEHTLDELIEKAIDYDAIDINGTNLSKGGNKKREKLSINKN